MLFIQDLKEHENYIIQIITADITYMYIGTFCQVHINKYNTLYEFKNVHNFDKKYKKMYIGLSSDIDIHIYQAPKVKSLQSICWSSLTNIQKQQLISNNHSPQTMGMYHYSTSDTMLMNIL